MTSPIPILDGVFELLCGGQGTRPGELVEGSIFCPGNFNKARSDGAVLTQPILGNLPHVDSAMQFGRYRLQLQDGGRPYFLFRAENGAWLTFDHGLWRVLLVEDVDLASLFKFVRQRIHSPSGPADVPVLALVQQRERPELPGLAIAYVAQQKRHDLSAISSGVLPPLLPDSYWIEDQYLVCTVRRVGVYPVTEDRAQRYTDVFDLAFPSPEKKVSVFDVPETARKPLAEYCLAIQKGDPAIKPTPVAPIDTLMLEQRHVTEAALELGRGNGYGTAFDTLYHIATLRKSVWDYFEGVMDIVERNFNKNHTILDEVTTQLDLDADTSLPVKTPNFSEVALAAILNPAIIPGMPVPFNAFMFVLQRIITIARATVEDRNKERFERRGDEYFVKVAQLLEELREESDTMRYAMERLRKMICASPYSLKAWEEADIHLPMSTEQMSEAYESAYKRSTWLTLLPLACVIRLEGNLKRFDDNQIPEGKTPSDIKIQVLEELRKDRPETLWVTQEKKTWINRARPGAWYLIHTAARLELRQSRISRAVWETLNGKLNLTYDQIANKLGIPVIS